MDYTMDYIQDCTSGPTCASPQGTGSGSSQDSGSAALGSDDCGGDDILAHRVWR